MLRAETVDVSYGEGLALHGVSIEVPPGQVVCLMGRNGVGKTTLLRTLAGVLRPRAGRVTLQGRDVTTWPTYRRARAGIAYVPQGRGIFPHLTVRENLLLGVEASGRRDPAAIEEGLTLFPALRRLLRQAAGTCSGGQQQQLAIARALVARPRWLLLDEPTEGVQPSIVGEIEAVIAAIRAEGRTAVLLVEQYLEFALRLADQYYVMENGMIVASGAIAEMDRARVDAALAL
ncbi:MAG TPA: urea ABC transporter ATP-binding subunit UrtE [Bacillota bacterium]|nr:urea ABC transporter ATP-binding subunit UrtE [Bacillota bacterium]